MSILEFLGEILPLLLILYAAVSAASIWVVRRASKDDVARVEAGVAALDKRLAGLEQTYPLLPTREDTHLLRLQMMELEGDMKTFAGQVSADRRQVVAELAGARELFGAQIKNADGLVRRLENQLRIIMDHNLNHRT